MDTSSDALASLPKGASVTVYFAVQSVQGNWCSIAVKSERQESGFVDCSQLHRGHAPSASVSGAAGVPSQDCEKLVDQLMDASGITSIFLGESGDYASTPALQRLSPTERAEIMAVARKQFNESAMKADIHQGLLNQCDPVDYAAMLDALRVPFAAHIIRLEIDAASPSGRSENKAYLLHMQEHPPSQERIAILQRLDQASDFGEYAIEVAMTMAASTSAAVAGHAPTQTQLDAVREQIAPPIRQALLMSWVAIYHRVSDADLERYVALWESEPIRQFEERLRGVVLEAAEMRASAVGTELKAYFNAQGARRTAQ
jgi:hypothetical protein